jgi:hypothetical protein
MYVKFIESCSTVQEVVVGSKCNKLVVNTAKETSLLPPLGTRGSALYCIIQEPKDTRGDLVYMRFRYLRLPLLYIC